MIGSKQYHKHNPGSDLVITSGPAVRAKVKGRPPKVQIVDAGSEYDPSTLKVSILFQPKQHDLLKLVEDSEATWIGYGGSRGGAKSYALRSIMLLKCTQEPKIKCVILRRTYDLVRENHVDPMLAEFPILRQYYHIGDKEIRFPNGSVLAFRYGETKGDIDGMIGKEYKYFGVDQAEAFTEKEIQVCRSCTRWSRSRAKMILTFNPGNVGHALLKRIFFDKKYHGREEPKDYAFLQAYGWDNVQWCIPQLVEAGLTEKDFYALDNDQRYEWFMKSDYGKVLDALPQSMRIGWLLGRMDKFSGQYFDIWDQERHVQRVVPQSFGPLWLGIDWGFAHSSVCLWAWGVNDKKTGIYRELNVKGYSPRALAQEIVDRTKPDEIARVKAIWLSHDAFAKRDEREPIAEQMGMVFTAAGLPYPSLAGRDPVSSASLIYDMLRSDSLVVDPACRSLIESIPMITRDEDNPEKPVKFEGDDAFDALRHAVKGRMAGMLAPGELAVAEQASRIKDPMSRWMFLTKSKQKKKSKVTFFDNIVPSWYYNSRGG